ncbi:MAG: hypothetical protein HZR80_00805 [Candidatus Heimdallarchaeota archaeon]
MTLFLGLCINYGKTVINAVDQPKNESNWVEIKIVNPNIDMMKLESWIFFETDIDDATEENDDWRWFFYKYEIWIRKAYLYGYKNPDIREFEVHTVTFETKFAGKKNGQTD